MAVPPTGDRKRATNVVWADDAWPRKSSRGWRSGLMDESEDESTNNMKLLEKNNFTLSM